MQNRQVFRTNQREHKLLQWDIVFCAVILLVTFFMSPKSVKGLRVSGT